MQDPAQAVSEAADRELQRAFQKEDFASMHVIGQFNLGFILARLGDNLFIIDQHAADEKYNFERLQQITRLNKQPMLQPLQLELTPAEKMTLWYSFFYWISLLQQTSPCEENSTVTAFALTATSGAQWT